MKINNYYKSEKGIYLSDVVVFLTKRKYERYVKDIENIIIDKQLKNKDLKIYLNVDYKKDFCRLYITDMKDTILFKKEYRNIEIKNSVRLVYRDKALFSENEIFKGEIRKCKQN